MKPFALALVAATLIATGASADVIRDLASTQSTITVHGVFDGR